MSGQLKPIRIKKKESEIKDSSEIPQRDPALSLDKIISELSQTDRIAHGVEMSSQGQEAKFRQELIEVMECLHERMLDLERRLNTKKG